jgi:hypothetical protein
MGSSHREWGFITTVIERACNRSTAAEWTSPRAARASVHENRIRRPSRYACTEDLETPRPHRRAPMSDRPRRRKAGCGLAQCRAAPTGVGLRLSIWVAGDKAQPHMLVLGRRHGQCESRRSHCETVRPGTFRALGSMRDEAQTVRAAATSRTRQRLIYRTPVTTLPLKALSTVGSAVRRSNASHGTQISTAPRTPPSRSRSATAPWIWALRRGSRGAL